MNQEQLIRQRQQKLQQAFQPQQQLIQQQMQALPGQFEGQRSSLEQARVNAFRDISQQANRRGMFFSGFQPAEQARYLGERFLPGMQDIEARQEQARMGLMDQLNQLRLQQSTGLMDFREQLRQEQLARQQREEDFARQQEATRQQQQFQAQQARAASAQQQQQASAASMQEALSAVQAEARSKAGSDGYISPSNFARIIGDATAMGVPQTEVQRILAGRVNPSHWQQYARAANIARGAQNFNVFQQILRGTYLR